MSSGVGKVALRVLIVGTSLWALYLLNYQFGWITPQTIDFFDAWNGVE